MKRPAAALLALLAAVAVGCGATNQPSQDFSAAEEDVADVIEDLQSAAQQDEPSTICTQVLSTALARRLGDRCTETIQSALDDTDVFEVDADRIRITGGRATARVDLGRDGERQATIELVRERQGGWRVDSFGDA